MLSLALFDSIDFFLNRVCPILNSIGRIVGNGECIFAVCGLSLLALKPSLHHVQILGLQLFCLVVARAVLYSQPNVCLCNICRKKLDLDIVIRLSIKMICVCN